MSEANGGGGGGMSDSALEFLAREHERLLEQLKRTTAEMRAFADRPTTGADDRALLYATISECQVMIDRSEQSRPIIEKRLERLRANRAKPRAK